MVEVDYPGHHDFPPGDYVCEEMGNGVICNGVFYPYDYTIDGADLNGVAGIRFFIKSMFIAIEPTVPNASVISRRGSGSKVTYLSSSTNPLVIVVFPQLLLNNGESLTWETANNPTWTSMVVYARIAV